jgi:hypothetical protein
VRKGQTLAERARELRKAGEAIDKLLAIGRVKVKVDRRTGGVIFTGIPDDVRSGMNDACVYRAIMKRGSHAAKQQIIKAQRLAGVTDERLKQVVGGQGLHSHDNGRTWGRD